MPVIIVRTTCKNIEQRFQKLWVSGLGQEAVFRQEDLGWWMTLTGSYESVYVGHEKPDGINSGDEIEISFKKV